MSVIGNLDEEVLDDFKEIHTFTRFTTIFDNLGREVKTALPTFPLNVFIHPISGREFKNIANEGYSNEEMLKLFGSLDIDIKQDDEVLYRGLNYRVLGVDTKVVGSYTKRLLGLIK